MGFGLNNDNFQWVDSNEGAKKKYPEGTIKKGVCQTVCVQAAQTKQLPKYHPRAYGLSEYKIFNDIS